MTGCLLLQAASFAAVSWVDEAVGDQGGLQHGSRQRGPLGEVPCKIRDTLEYLVSWDGYDSDENSWG